MASPVRFTHLVVEVIRKATTPPARVTHEVVEVIRQATAPPARVTHEAIEVVRAGSLPLIRFSHQIVEVLRKAPLGPRNGRISQVYTDTLRNQVPTTALVSHVYTDTIQVNPPVAKPGLKSWMVFDKTGFFDITMISGTPTSAADIHAVLNGANALALGQEILQFRDATDLGSGVYRLSYLLRGRLGSEQFMNSHVASELAYFLSTSTTRRVLGELADLNNIRYWKVVGIGQTLNSRSPIFNINTGVSQKPWAPVRIAGTRDGGLNLTVTWVRRSRLGHQRLLVSPPPVGEVQEEYQVDILNSGGAVVRTFSPLTATQDYTAAQQITDFGVEQPAILVRVGQVSEAVGLGYTNSELL